MARFDSAADLARALGWPTLTAGILTGAASYLVVEPRDDSTELTRGRNSGNQQ
ncbi:hypothetical protein SAMN04489751_2710 [Brevibacterium sandarakinum]|uniref:Uncharacterized protein n=1 Tax=Brevibacterium sandarakinum TaxID=629680 RepID=A0A1H1ULC5_BRESA|nr:hypothetical protein SAMN04489751_2710 [Brevibacterium sandarakinum]